MIEVQQVEFFAISRGNLATRDKFLPVFEGKPYFEKKNLRQKFGKKYCLCC